MSEFAHTVLRAGSHVVRLARRVTPLLVPGSGWSGATAQPDAVGDSQAFGYDAKAIARWDVVPFQTFAGTFNVGVVAFHIEGIDRVEFSVNGGNWQPATSMRLNPTTNVVEYFVALRASDFADGPVEVRAIAWPNIGEPRVLAGALPGTHGEHSMFLNANANGTLPAEVRYVSPTGSDSNNGLTPETPKLTLSGARDGINPTNFSDVGGGRILCAAGNYTLGRNPENIGRNCATQWLTIEPMPGVARADVIIDAKGTADGIRTGKVRLRNITVKVELSGNGPQEDYYWLDNCHIEGPDRTSMSVAGTSLTGYYLTDCTVNKIRYLARNCVLMRNVVASEIGEDAFGYATINCTITDLDSDNESFHPDVLQMFGNAQNVIFYGVTANDGMVGQGIFHDGNGAIRDIAIVDSDVRVTGSFYHWQLMGNTTNLLAKNCTFGGGVGAIWRENFVGTNVVIDAVTWLNGSPGARSGVTYRN
jgi:hypothetical protein